MTILLNLIGGLLPTFALAASIASGTEDDARHRRVFLLVYGLWLLTLAMYNWMRSTHVGWIALWGSLGVVVLVVLAVKAKRARGA